MYGESKLWTIFLEKGRKCNDGNPIQLGVFNVWVQKWMYQKGVLQFGCTVPNVFGKGV